MLESLNNITGELHPFLTLQSYSSVIIMVSTKMVNSGAEPTIFTVRASVLHGVKDLRIVSDLIGYSLIRGTDAF